MLGDLCFVQTLYYLTWVSFISSGVDGFSCKFPNEGCRVNKDCCSGKCEDAHPGTNPRCTRLSLHHTCLYTYQCDDRLRCGASNTCCAKYWGICSKKADCCDPQHSCYETDGFYYKRCLYANGAGGNEPTTVTRKWLAFVGLDIGTLGENGCPLRRVVESVVFSCLLLVVVGVFCGFAVGNSSNVTGMVVGSKKSGVSGGGVSGSLSIDGEVENVDDDGDDDDDDDDDDDNHDEGSKEDKGKYHDDDCDVGDANDDDDDQDDDFGGGGGGGGGGGSSNNYFHKELKSTAGLEVEKFGGLFF